MVSPGRGKLIHSVTEGFNPRCFWNLFLKIQTDRTNKAGVDSFCKMKIVEELHESGHNNSILFIRGNS